MKKIYLILRIFVLFIVICCACNLDPLMVLPSGRSTINTEIIEFQLNGLSFSEGRVIQFPNSEGTDPDIIVQVHTDEQGIVRGVFLSTPSFPRPAFRLLRQFGTLDDAEMYYENLSAIPDTIFIDVALPVIAGQVWAVQTRDARYAKILIRNTKISVDSSQTGAQELYGEATLDWTYQPDGSRKF